jgi:hypothetical protein
VPGHHEAIADDGAVAQGALTVIVPIEAGRTEALRVVLDRIDRDEAGGTDVEDNPWVPFARLTRVHFARWLIFDEALDVDGRTIPASLVFCSNFDGPRAAHLRELIDVAGPGLDLIYGHCVGYPGRGHEDAGGVLAYLEGHAVRVNTFYNGTYGKSVGQIRREAALREAIGAFLDERMSHGTGVETGAEVRAAVREFVGGAPELAWALTPPRRTRPPFPGGAVGAVAVAVVAIALLGALVASPVRTLLALLYLVLTLALVVGGWLLLLRRNEKRDEADAWTEKHRPKAPELARREDRVVQNQLSSVINIKPGFVRKWTLRTVLTAIDFAARYIFYKGSLGSIPSIHFARWVITDDGRRLAFFSNFDGSWESYLGEFVDRASTGLTAVWSNCVRFPSTRWLIHDGARDEQAFKSYARDRQVVTHVWYSAYKTLTMVNITNNSELRRGLSGDMNPEELSVWLRRL